MKQPIKTRFAQRFLIAILSLGLIGAAGCSSLLAPRPDRSKFYVLTPEPSAGQVSQASAGAGMSIGLGPITTPDYLDRPEIVTRTGPNELHLSENDRWAEPLGVGFAHVLARDLAARLSAAQIHSFPWYNSTPINYQVEIQVHHFETDSSGRSELVAHWAIVNGRTHDIIDSASTTLARSGSPGDTAVGVAALSQILGEFSDQIATRLRGLNEQRQARTGTSTQ